MNNLLGDLRYAVRTLVRSPGFALASVATLALGIGGAATIFAGVDALFLRALPLPKPDRIVTLWSKNRAGGFDHANVSYRDFEDWRRDVRGFAHVAALFDVGPTLTGRAVPEPFPSARVTGDYFAVLGLKPRLGRLLGPADDRPDAPRALVLSDGAWRRRFGADPGVVGRVIGLDGQPVTVVGVLPAGAGHPGDDWMEGWTALGPDLGNPERGDRSYRVIARLRDGVSLAEIRAELDAVSRRLGEAYPTSSRGYEVNVLPFEEDLFGRELRVGLVTLLAAVGLVLVIGCANVAQLLLARGAARQREIGVRTALGATRGRLVRQMLTEDLVLAVAGGAAGLLLAVWGVGAFTKFLPEGTARVGEIRFDPRVVGFGLLLSFGTAALFGWLPAWNASRSGIAETLASFGTRGAAGGRGRRLQAFLVASEVALAVVLLSGAGLLAKSLWRLRAVDPGFHQRHAVTLQIELPERRYPDDSRVAAFYRSLLERLAALPGVRAAAAVNTIPLGGSNSWSFASIPGKTVPGQEPRAGRMVVSPDYFRAIGIPLLEGRVFGPEDAASSRPVAIVNRDMARRFWPGESAIGKRVKRGRLDDPLRPWFEIVGVVGDVRHRGLAVDVRPEMYVPLAQFPERDMVVVLSADGEIAGLLDGARRQLHAIDPDLAASRVRSLDELVRADTASASLLARLIGAFALAAAALAAIGLYAVVSLAVGQSSREIGIRMAIGARPSDVLAMVLRRWLRLAFAGMAVGIAATLALGKSVAAILYATRPTDPAVLAAIVTLLGLVAAAAALLPARRAARLDPAAALRAE